MTILGWDQRQHGYRSNVLFSRLALPRGVRRVHWFFHLVRSVGLTFPRSLIKGRCELPVATERRCSIGALILQFGNKLF